MRSKYRMGWLIVCFDLPVGEKEEIRETNNFRKSLLKQGYFMLQNSIYVRSCVTYDKTDIHIRNLKLIAPNTGTIIAFYITDRQWSLSINIERTNYKKSKYKKNAGENGYKQMTFW